MHLISLQFVAVLATICLLLALVLCSYFCCGLCWCNYHISCSFRFVLSLLVPFLDGLGLDIYHLYFVQTLLNGFLALAALAKNVEGNNDGFEFVFVC